MQPVFQILTFEQSYFICIKTEKKVMDNFQKIFIMQEKWSSERLIACDTFRLLWWWDPNKPTALCFDKLKPNCSCMSNSGPISNSSFIKPSSWDNASIYLFPFAVRKSLGNLMDNMLSQQCSPMEKMKAYWRRISKSVTSRWREVASPPLLNTAEIASTMLCLVLWFC